MVETCECDGCVRRKRPHFFKVLLETSREQLVPFSFSFLAIRGFRECHRLPPAFAHHIGKVSSPVTLETMAVKSWPVELTNDSGLVFKNGWEDFYKHHSLETGDFLIFRYNGNMHFSVRIYGRSYCEDSYVLTDEHQGGMNHLDRPVHLPSLRPQGGDDDDDCVELCSTCRGSGIARASGKIVKKPNSNASVDRKKFLPGYPSFKIVLKREGGHVQRNVEGPMVEHQCSSSYGNELCVFISMDAIPVYACLCMDPRHENVKSALPSATPSLDGREVSR
ncbi:B3 domain-containing protein [Nymphaea thermarum]|nr:B3 domain-containing protein [Nymphaea thermarum]